MACGGLGRQTVLGVSRGVQVMGVGVIQEGARGSDRGGDEAGIRGSVRV